ncbi:MAG: serine-type D-Ala-D-Ala carboxypeptidase [Haliea sp.]|uniref:D-alanyl-D-alanine carboxypeptidase family protein n=1 Tax=Haliea sp. TaxID=1932666 RepID=UPI000C4640CF|nr:D-alanyl-D-alanine carboxypeptidase family protein [Haliea sp.]MBM69513.1 serine-type D-Ala-D-Ala carboxypeptidase [Haliea sp.]|tara:strand:+ start:21036 stop:22199 length:1164 start_codon:yes stop_codon:yes gene_type:complete
MTRFVCSLLLVLASGFAQAAIVPAPPQVAAEAYLLIDADTGAVLAEGNADEPRPPASLVKMMTAYVLAGEIESGRVSADDMVTVSRNAWSQNPVFNGSSLMWIEPGKDVSIRDLEHGIIISSGNDATVAVAEHLAGSEEAFADMMNSYAKALGMTNSHFANSHGLPAEGQVVTARDLAKLSAAMINDFPEHYSLYKKREFTYNNIRQYNRNSLLGEDPSVDGIKTGYTKEAGYGLVASAERDGMRLISVVLGTRSPTARKNETRGLLNYGFRFFETVELFTAEQELAQPRVWKGLQDSVAVGVLEAARVTLPRGQREAMETVVELDTTLVAPIARGDQVGTVRLTQGDDTVFEAPVVALASVEQAGFFARVWDSIRLWFSQLFSVEG